MLALLASRALGIVRQILLNTIFGTGPAADAYYAAAYLPETLFDLVAGGALIYAFIPVFLSYEKDHGQREAWRLASLVFNALLLVLSLATLVGEFFAPAFVTHWLVPGYPPDKQALTISLTRVMLFQPLLLGLSTVITAALNSKRQFLLSALSVAIYNVGLIGGLVVSLLVPAVGIYGPTYGTLVAAALQVLVMVPALVKQGASYSFSWNFRHPGFLDIMRLLIPNALAVTISSIAPIIDTNFISHMPGGFLAAQRNAYMLYGLPFALLTQAIGQAAMPQLSALFASHKYLRLRLTLSKLLLFSVGASVLAALVLGPCGQIAIVLLFQHGAFGAQSASLTETALLGYALALPLQTAAMFLILAFYAMRNALTPLYATALTLLTHFLSILVLLQFFTGTQQLIAIPLALASDGLIATLLLGFLLLWQLRRPNYVDKGMQRLTRRRTYQALQQEASSS